MRPRPSGISPAVFSSLFQAVKSPEPRRELAEHYTRETDILKPLGPLFLDDMRERFAEHTHSLSKLEELKELRIVETSGAERIQFSKIYDLTK